MVQVKWNYEDARFTCYDDEIFMDEVAAKKSIYDWAIKHREELFDSSYIEIDEGKIWDSIRGIKIVVYEEWVEWCIDSFCAFDKVKIHR